jgi:phospholipase C
VRAPDPKRSGIDHVVVVMMENRSFDHMLGWLPGAARRALPRKRTGGSSFGELARGFGFQVQA